MEKITYLGKQVYPREPKTQRFAKKEKKGSKAFAIFAFVCFVVVGSYFTFGTYAQAFADWTVNSIANMIAPEVHAENGIDGTAVAKAIMSNRVDALENGVVADIEKCESGGNYGLIIFDTNNEASIGGLQFQRKTVMHYEDTLYGKRIGAADAIEIAIHPDTARALAKDIIFNAGGIGNWFNCSAKINGAARVAAIESLQ